MKPPKKGYHRHHVLPKHAGGTDDDDNIVYLTVDEHIVAHRKLFEQFGNPADVAAANYLEASRQLGFNEAKHFFFIEMCKRGASNAHLAKQQNGFYAKLGKMNGDRLRGKQQPHLTAASVKAVGGSQWYNNGVEDRRLSLCPDGWKEGRLFQHDTATKQRVSAKMSAMRWWTDGKVNKRSQHQPSSEFILGRSKGNNHAQV